MPPSGRIANKVERLQRRHRARLSGLCGVELPGIGTVVGHDDPHIITAKQNNFTIIGLFLECDKVQGSLRHGQHALKAKALELFPCILPAERSGVIIAQNPSDTLIDQAT